MPVQVLLTSFDRSYRRPWCPEPHEGTWDWYEIDPTSTLKIPADAVTKLATPKGRRIYQLVDHKWVNSWFLAGLGGFPAIPPGRVVKVTNHLGGGKCVYVSVSWVGGWDDYLVDPDQVRDQTKQEKASDRLFAVIGDRDWLKARFVLNHSVLKMTPDQCVKVVKHLGGGD